MKRILIIIGILLLAACGSIEAEEPNIEETKVIEKKTEMSQVVALDYMERITHRYFNSDDHESGSFGWKSELQAGIKQADIAIIELNEEYEGVPVAKSLLVLAEEVRGTFRVALDGNPRALITESHSVGKLMGSISSEHLNGELPPTAKFRIGNREAENASK